MSSPEAFSAVRALVEAEFSLCPVVWPNEGSAADTGMPFVYCEVTGAVTRRIEIGIGATEETGTVWCHIFVPVGTGTTEQKTIAKALSRLFLLARDSPLSFGDQSTAQGEQGDDDGMLWRQTLTIEYSHQELD